MDFTFTDDQNEIRALAARIFGDRATPERVKAMEDSTDPQLWSALGDAGLLALAVPEAHGGSGLGLVEACLVLEEQGRAVAPVPLWPTLVAALALAEHGSGAQQSQWLGAVATGAAVLTLGFEELGGAEAWEPRTAAAADGDAWKLTGEKLAVPFLPIADAVLVSALGPDGVALFLVERGATGVTVEPVEQTDRLPAGHLRLDAAPASIVGSGEHAVRAVVDRAYAAIAAVQVGVCEEALRRAAEYSSTRQQFGKALSTFQGVALRAADAYIDTEALRSTVWQAAWRIDHGLDATTEALVAKWWACEAGHRVVHAAQHLHGGIGADVDYPQHRWFLWGTQLQDTLGGSGRVNARLGQVLAETEVA
jgi:3-oxocholest-4-en-26-oyl-CoA dehydrogenase beta subunit